MGRPPVTGFMNAASCDGGDGRPPIHKTAAAGAGIRDVPPLPASRFSPPPPGNVGGAGRGKRSAPPHRPPSPPLPPQASPAGRPDPAPPQRGRGEVAAGGVRGFPPRTPPAPRLPGVFMNEKAVCK